MKAIVQEGYGSPDTLKLREIEMPTCGDDGVMVEVHAASVNALDWHVARGVPFFIPILEAIGAPKHRVRGVVRGRLIGRGKRTARAGDVGANVRDAGRRGKIGLAGTTRRMQHR